MSLFFDRAGRVWYSMSMRAEYSRMARDMRTAGIIEDLAEAHGLFLMPALLELTFAERKCTITIEDPANAEEDTVGARTAEVNYKLENGYSYQSPPHTRAREEQLGHESLIASSSLKCSRCSSLSDAHAPLDSPRRLEAGAEG
jgi:hypothetical protein